MRDDPIFDKYLEKDDDGGYAGRATYTANRELQNWNHDDYAKTEWTSSSTSGQHSKTTERYLLWPLAEASNV